MQQVRLILWAVVGVVGLAVAGLLYFLPNSNSSSNGRENITVVNKGEVAATQTGYGLGPDFQFIDHTGAPITQNDLLGHPVAIFFGFTHCPEICPSTMTDLAFYQEELGEIGDKLKPVFVTIDPARDTAPVIKEYVDVINTRMVGITGDVEGMARFAAAWGVFVEQQAPPEGDDNYNIDHTASVFLIAPDGQFRGTIALNEAKSVAMQKLSNLVSGT